MPANCPSGVRPKGDASLAQAPVRNVGTCASMRWPTEAATSIGCQRESSKQQELQGAEYRTRRTGADCPVVVMKPGNAGGAKGAGYPGLVSSQPPSGRS